MSGTAVADELPVVKKLKEVDERYLALHKEYELERSELAKKFNEKQQQFLTKRKELLTAEKEGREKIGTPSLQNFWCKAIQSHEAFHDKIRYWDEPVLEYLSDVEVERFDPENTGFKLIFRFSENPYFSNSELFVEYHLRDVNPYMESVDVEKVVASKINWKEGQDVTVSTEMKKVKGGGAKKSKQKKEQTQDRPSFFGDIFSSLNKDMSIPEVAAFAHIDEKELNMMQDPRMLVELVSRILGSHYECGVALRDNIIPFAVRWYTGEACDSESDSDDYDDEDEEEESEGEGDEEESEADAESKVEKK